MPTDTDRYNEEDDRPRTVQEEASDININTAQHGRPMTKGDSSLHGKKKNR